MYDTEKRVRLVKKRVLEKRYWQERSLICRLSVLCMVLFVLLVGTAGAVTGKSRLMSRSFRTGRHRSRHRECMALFFCMRMPGAMC